MLRIVAQAGQLSCGGHQRVAMTSPPLQASLKSCGLLLRRPRCESQWESSSRTHRKHHHSVTSTGLRGSGPNGCCALRTRKKLMRTPNKDGCSCMERRTLTRTTASASIPQLPHRMGIGFAAIAPIRSNKPAVSQGRGL
jgi:hypothetical protein